MALRVTQTPVEVVLDQDPALRVTQTPVEVVLDQDPNLRVTQVVVEAIFLEGGIRVTQLATEVVIGGPGSGATEGTGEARVSAATVEVAADAAGVALRASQITPEVVGKTNASIAFVSQVAPEVVDQGNTSPVRVSQIIVELVKTFTCARPVNSPEGPYGDYPFHCPPEEADITICPGGASTVDACDDPAASAVDDCIEPGNSSVDVCDVDASSVEIPRPPASEDPC